MNLFDRKILDIYGLVHYTHTAAYNETIENRSFFSQAPKTIARSTLGIHNLSSQPLTHQVVQLLKKGLSYSPTPTQHSTEAQLDILKKFDEY